LLGFIPFVHASNVAAGVYDRAVFYSTSLRDLPDHPRFVFTSTSLQTGVLWRFAKEYAAEWRVGKWADPDLRLALAVAASAGFPPLLSPARIKPPKGSIKSWGEPTTLTALGFTKRLFLTDGGVRQSGPRASLETLSDTPRQRRRSGDKTDRSTVHELLLTIP
jgi:NTE family protein